MREIQRKTRPNWLVLVVGIVMWAMAWSAPARGQNLDKTVMNVDEEVTAFAYAPDGRIVFSVRKMYKAKRYDLQRDDIWILDTNGKKKRIFSGEKFTHGDKPLTYQVESFTWSPNAHIVAVELFVTTVDLEDGHTEDSKALLFVDDAGHEIRPGGKETLVDNAQGPMWLRDNATVVYMTDKDNPPGLYSMEFVSVTSGPTGKVFEGRTFVDAARISGSDAAIAVERDRNMDGPPRIQHLEMLAQEDKELATLDAWAGELTVSPSGTKAAYYLDKEVLEIRDLTAPNKVARLRVGLGVLKWSADESKVYLKRTIEKKSADLVVIAVPELVAYGARQEIPVSEPTPNVLLHGLTIREFGLSRDGRFLAVVLPGKRNLQIFGF
jgi:hypothetical protein